MKKARFKRIVKDWGFRIAYSLMILAAVLGCLIAGSAWLMLGVLLVKGFRF